jgi:NitT/TauT family transport system permease protein
MRIPKLNLNLLLPLIGPLLLLGLWELAISAKWVKPVLLPPPGDTLIFLWKSLISGAMNIDLLATLRRTLYAFGVATLVGVPLGIALGSSRNIYRSVEFLVDFFRSTPSSALIPLFLLIFGITDLNKVAIAAFAAVLVILFNSA